MVKRSELAAMIPCDSYRVPDGDEREDKTRVSRWFYRGGDAPTERAAGTHYLQCPPWFDDVWIAAMAQWYVETSEKTREKDSSGRLHTGPKCSAYELRLAEQKILRDAQVERYSILSLKVIQDALDHRDQLLWTEYLLVVEWPIRFSIKRSKEHWT